MLVGYARCSTDAQDLTAQRDALIALGVKPNRIYLDHGLTGTNRARPGLREALAACRSGDTLVVTKLDRLARSLPDARDIVEELTNAGVKLNIGGSIHDSHDPVGRLLFNVLAMIAEFESDLIKMRTREGMKVAKAKGRLRGKQPKLNPQARNAPRGAVARRPAHQRRARRTILHRPIDRLPRRTACRRADSITASSRASRRGFANEAQDTQPPALTRDPHRRPIATLHFGSASGVPGLVAPTGVDVLIDAGQTDGLAGRGEHAGALGYQLLDAGRGMPDPPSAQMGEALVNETANLLAGPNHCT
jgi:DNA invertase Pin-like site-specific DNA recombinase